jgi:heme exporter protein B
LSNKVFLEMKHVFYIATKDLKMEIKRKYEVISMITFALISVLVSSFSLGPFFPYPNETAPALIWIIFLFSGMLGFYTAFAREMEQGTIDGLRVLPTSPQAILVGKILYGFFLMSVIESVVIPLSMVLFGYSFNSNPLFVVLIFALGTLDFAVVGATVSGLAMYTESRTIMIPLLTFPLVLPVIIPSVILTKKLVYGLAFSLALPELRIMALSIIALFVATILLFEYILLD